MLSFANDSFRKAASVVFDASTSTLSVGNRNFISEILDALEDVGTSPSSSPSPLSTGVKTSQNVTIPTNDVNVNGVRNVEPMSVSTTLGSSVDSDASDVPRNVAGQTTEEEGNDNDDTVDKATSLPIITMYEVGDHYTTNDAWMVIYDRVYDFSSFLSELPSSRLY